MWKKFVQQSIKNSLTKHHKTNLEVCSVGDGETDAVDDALNEEFRVSTGRNSDNGVCVVLEAFDVVLVAGGKSFAIFVGLTVILT